MTFKVKFDESREGYLVIKKNPLNFAGLLVGRMIQVTFLSLIFSVVVSLILSFSGIVSGVIFLIVLGLAFFFSLKELWEFYPSVFVDAHAQTVGRKGEVVARVNEISNVTVEYVTKGSGKSKRRFYELRLTKRRGEILTIDRITEYGQALYAGDAIADLLDKPLHYG